jgi:hypothetical protein
VAEVMDDASRKRCCLRRPRREREIKPLRDIQRIVRNYDSIGQGFLEISNVHVALFRRYQPQVVGYAGLRI